MMANKPVEIVQLAGDAGKYKANLGATNFLVRSFMAGLFIAVGGALCTICSTGLETSMGPGFRALVTGAVFPVGLIAIVITGMSLFTGDTMLIPMAVFQGKSTWGKVLNAWFWVYIGNFIGSLFWAYLMAVGPFSKGAISSKNMVGKFFGIWFPIMAFVSSGFEHSVANMYFIPAGIMLGAKVTWGQFIQWNLIPVTIGNIVGGFLFIGAVYYYSFKKELSSIAPT
ncbi:MAG: formate/nitrite transporter family protein [Proteobacteria bacterium]|nr:formate/nitrite transporter family protein [Pseudomonadota bacterium]